ncbi:unnamed protein product [Effrenium voratum]|nr:unnamed protein product [Effrenium voratum]
MPCTTQAKWSGTSLPKRSLADTLAYLASNGEPSPLPMARFPDPVVRMVANSVPEWAFGHLELLAEALRLTRREEQAVGLAASQVGVDARIIVLDAQIAAGPDVFVNPEIVERSPEEDMRWWREQCLVLPEDVLVTLMRDSEIAVEARDLRGRPFLQRMDGEQARAFQHELDHLNGILILDHATEDPGSAFPAIGAELRSVDHARRQGLALARPVAQSTVLQSLERALKSFLSEEALDTCPAPPKRRLRLMRRLSSPSLPDSEAEIPEEACRASASPRRAEPQPRDPLEGCTPATWRLFRGRSFLQRLPSPEGPLHLAGLKVSEARLGELRAPKARAEKLK